MTVLIVDYGMGNLASVKKAVEKVGGTATISKDPDDVALAERIILPGVGSFRKAMENLGAAGWIERLREDVTRRRLPLLGICLGMQLLADEGYEDGLSTGLGLIHGEVIKIPNVSSEVLRIPHVGWNEIHISLVDDPLLDGVHNNTDFYFVHSYHFKASEPESIIATTHYGLALASVVRSGAVWGTQFHPEKSGPAGLQILRNFLHL